MRRGELYRVAKGSPLDPKKWRIFVVVSRQVALDSRFSTAICAPIFSVNDGLSTQVAVGIAEGLAHDSCIHCDELISIPKTALTDYVGSLSTPKLEALDRALAIALNLEQTS